MTDTPVIQLDTYWPYQVVFLADLVSKHTTSVLRMHGNLNLSQWRVLAAIGEKPGRSAAEVVAVTPMDKGIVSRAAASLIRDGYVRKKSDPDDKRRSELFLTAKGQKHYAAVSQALIQELSALDVPERLSSVLSEQIANMKAVLSAP